MGVEKQTKLETEKTREFMPKTLTKKALQEFYLDGPLQIFHRLAIFNFSFPLSLRKLCLPDLQPFGRPFAYLACLPISPARLTVSPTRPSSTRPSVCAARPTSLLLVLQFLLLVPLFLLFLDSLLRRYF
jgi:hypothetical protein